MAYNLIPRECDGPYAILNSFHSNSIYSRISRMSRQARSSASRLILLTRTIFTISDIPDSWTLSKLVLRNAWFV